MMNLLFGIGFGMGDLSISGRPAPERESVKNKVNNRDNKEDKKASGKSHKK